MCKDYGWELISEKIDGCDNKRQAEIKKISSQELTFTGLFLSERID